MSEGAAERTEAARMLHAVVAGGRTTDQVSAGRAPSPLTLELLLGSLRHYYSLERAVRAALHRPLKPKDLELRSLMIVGAYQLRYLRVPDHAAIFETVAACAALGRPWARGLVNAVLRKLAAAPAPAEPCLEHPPWLEQALRREYPEAEQLMAANNRRAPMTLRINLARGTVDDYLARLAAAGIESRPPGVGPVGSGAEGTGLIRLGPETRILASPRPARELPGYAEGLVGIQDAGAQYAAALLAPEPGDRVLDACAAPGGKLFHLLERCPGARPTALETRAERLATLQAEADRLGHDGFAALSADARSLDWWDGNLYRRILLDAPCSGTGTLRRHPDIKILRQESELDGFAALQGALLRSVWRVLEPGGTLLYCTCSLLAGENDEVVHAFLAGQDDALVSPFSLATGRATRHGWQLLPTDGETDGFYYSRMTRVSG